jgi:germination protein M
MKKEKNRLKKSLPWLAVSVILAAVSVVVVIIIIANYNSKQKIYPFTYLTKAENSADLFASEARYFPSEEYLTNTNYVLNLLFRGPRSNNLKSPFPVNARTLSVIVNDSILNIDLSSEYLNQSNFEMLLSDYCIVSTLSHMGVYDGYILTISGSPHPIHGSEALTEIAFIAELSGLSPVTREIKFYLPDFENKNLETHVYLIRMYLSDDVLQLTMQKLLGFLSLNNTCLLSITLESGLLTVNLSDDIVFFNSLNRTYSELILYSIIDTMANLPDVSLVRIIVEGEPLEFFGNIPTSQPFTPNSKLIGNKVIIH